MGTPGPSERAYVDFPPFEDWSGRDLDDQMFSSSYDKFLAEVSSAEEEEIATALSRLTRQAAVESVAIEGFYDLKPGESRSVATEESGWQSILESADGSNLRLFASQLGAFQYAHEYVREGRPVNETMIRELHHISCDGQAYFEVVIPDHSDGFRVERRELKRGSYKEFSNNVINRDGATQWYCPPTRVAEEMARFIEELKSSALEEQSPILRAAYAHYVLTHIHPFDDGNGRVARALAAFYTFQSYQVPIVIPSDRKRSYLQALEAGQAGRHQEVTSYFLDRTVDSLYQATLEIRSIRSGGSASRLRRFVDTIDRVADLTVEDLQSVAPRLFEVASSKFVSKVESIVRESDGRLTSIPTEYSTGPYVHLPYGWVDSNAYDIATYISTHLETSGPIKATVYSHFLVGIAQETGRSFSFCLALKIDHRVASAEPDEITHIRLEDCVPDLSSGTVDRIELFAEVCVERILDALQGEIENLVRLTGNAPNSDS